MNKIEILTYLFSGKNFSWVALNEHEVIRLHNLSEKRRICKIYKTKA